MKIKNLLRNKMHLFVLKFRKIWVKALSLGYELEQYRGATGPNLYAKKRHR